MCGRFPVGKRKTAQTQQDGSVQKWRSLAAPAREKKIRTAVKARAKAWRAQTGWLSAPY